MKNFILVSIVTFLDMLLILLYITSFQGDFKQALFSLPSGPVPGILGEEEGDITIPDIQFQEGELDELDEEFDLEMTANESALEYAGRPNPDMSEMMLHKTSDNTAGEESQQ